MGEKLKDLNRLYVCLVKEERYAELEGVTDNKQFWKSLMRGLFVK